MKRLSTLIALVTLVVLLSPNVLAAGVTGTVLISGAQDGLDLAKLLAPAFTAKNPGVRIITELTSTAVGLDAVKNGKADLASTSRDVQPSEGNFTKCSFGRQAVTVIVNASNPVNNLTLDQVKAIFAGDVMNWSEVGGPAADIAVVIREIGATPRTAFESMIMGDMPLSMDAKTIGSKKGAMAEVGKNPAAITFSTSTLDNSVKAIAIDGISPTAENIESGSYKATMPLMFIGKAQPSAATKAFLAFVESDEGKKLANGK